MNGQHIEFVVRLSVTESGPSTSGSAALPSTIALPTPMTASITAIDLGLASIAIAALCVAMFVFRNASGRRGQSANHASKPGGQASRSSSGDDALIPILMMTHPSSKHHHHHHDTHTDQSSSDGGSPGDVGGGGGDSGGGGGGGDGGGGGGGD